MPRKKSIEEIEDEVLKDPIFVKNPALERLPPDHPAIAVTKSVLIDGEQVTRGAIPRDPLKVKLRLYIQVAEMLHTLETGQGDDGPVTMRERIAALTAIGRLQNLLVDKAKDDDENAGSAIRKYESAFKNGARRRTKIARSAAIELERDSGSSDGEDGSPDSYDLDAGSGRDDLDAAD